MLSFHSLSSQPNSLKITINRSIYKRSFQQSSIPCCHNKKHVMNMHYYYRLCKKAASAQEGYSWCTIRYCTTVVLPAPHHSKKTGSCNKKCWAYTSADNVHRCYTSVARPSRLTKAQPKALAKAPSRNNSLAVIQERASNHSILHVALDRVRDIKHRAYPALGILCASFVGMVLGDDGHATVLCHLQSIR